MKTIFALLFMLFTVPAFASGKISFKQKYDGPEPGRYSLGLSIYEKIIPHVFFSSWNGGGAEMKTGANPWLKTDNAIYFRVGALAFGVGGEVKFLPHVHSENHNWYLNVTADLW